MTPRLDVDSFAMKVAGEESGGRRRDGQLQCRSELIQLPPRAVGISSWPDSYFDSHVRLFVLSAPPALPIFPPQICTTKTSRSHQRDLCSEGIRFEFDLFWDGAVWPAPDLQGSSVLFPSA